MSNKEQTLTAEQFLNEHGIPNMPTQYLIEYQTEVKNTAQALEKYAQAKVLEALERVQNKAQTEADFINDYDSIEDRYSRSAFRNIVEFIETEVKTKYER